jgi:hypothetical protein
VSKSVDLRVTLRLTGEPKVLGSASAGAFEPVLAEKARLHRGGRFVISVEDVGIEVDAVRPGDGSGNRIDCDCRKGLVVVDRSENARQRVGEVEFAHDAVGERDPQRAHVEKLNVADTCEIGHAHRLLEGINDRKGGRFLSEGPVGSELVEMKGPPLFDESGRRLREASSDERAVVDAEQGLVLGIDRMEMRRVVISEVHVDHDPVELTQPWHVLNLRQG